jgi:hypothetical protein
MLPPHIGSGHLVGIVVSREDEPSVLIVEDIA